MSDSDSPKMRLSNAYYTRFHIWQTLVRYSKIKAEDLAGLAEKGWAFVWNDGEDVLEEDDSPQSPTVIPIDQGGSYL